MKYIYPKRGKSTEIHKAKFKQHELFYITDLKMLGVVDNNGEAQLLVEVLEFDNKESFPKEGQPSKLYKDKSNITYFFDGVNYLPVEMNIYSNGAMPNWFPSKQYAVKVRLQD